MVLGWECPTEAQSQTTQTWSPQNLKRLESQRITPKNLPGHSIGSHTLWRLWTLWIQLFDNRFFAGNQIIDQKPCFLFLCLSLLDNIFSLSLLLLVNSFLLDVNSWRTRIILCFFLYDRGLPRCLVYMNVNKSCKEGMGRLDSRYRWLVTTFTTCGIQEVSCPFMVAQSFAPQLNLPSLDYIPDSKIVSSYTHMKTSISWWLPVIL